MNKEDAKKQLAAESATISSVRVITTSRAKEIIDKIELDHPKVKLPQEVGEELDEYKRGFEHDIDVLGFLTDVDNLMELNKTYAWMYESDGDRSSHVNRLADAYRYGWEAEPEAKWYVKTPKEWWEEPDVPEWMHLDTQCGVCSGFNKPSRTAFTSAELKKHHFDSDIFTLVPVEEEK